MVVPTFEYHSMSKTGQAQSGTIDAATRSEVVRLLRQRGEIATNVVAMNTATMDQHADTPAVSTSGRNGSGSGSAASFGGGGLTGAEDLSVPSAIKQIRVGSTSMSRSELASFIREIATALEAGLPLLNALRAVRKQASVKQAAILEHLMDRIESGRSLAQAMMEWGRPFDDMVVGMIRAGEAAGRLDVVMLQLADLLDRDVEMRRSIAGALVYPAILILVLSIGISVIVTFIVPKVLAAIEGDVAALPMPTRIVKGTADFFASYWYILIGAGFVITIGSRAALRNPLRRRAFDQFTLKIPVVGNMLRDVAVARFTRTLGTLMSAGIPILDALHITRDTLGNKALEHTVDGVNEQIRQGKSIAEPMERSGYFPPLLIQIIGLGERSGRLDEMLTQAANSFDRKTQSSIKLFTQVLPPLIVVVMAMVVGFVLAAVLLPLLEMQSAIG